MTINFLQLKRIFVRKPWEKAALNVFHSIVKIQCPKFPTNAESNMPYHYSAGWLYGVRIAVALVSHTPPSHQNKIARKSQLIWNRTEVHPLSLAFCPLNPFALLLLWPPPEKKGDSRTSPRHHPILMKKKPSCRWSWVHKDRKGHISPWPSSGVKRQRSKGCSFYVSGPCNTIHQVVQGYRRYAGGRGGVGGNSTSSSSSSRRSGSGCGSGNGSGSGSGSTSNKSSSLQMYRCMRTHRQLLPSQVSKQKSVEMNSKFVRLRNSESSGCRQSLVSGDCRSQTPIDCLNPQRTTLIEPLWPTSAATLGNVTSRSSSFGGPSGQDAVPTKTSASPRG